jgi:hypothetical protein
MTMPFRHALCASLLALAPAAAYAGSTPQESFDAVSQCLHRHDTKHCRSQLTADSLSIYDRFVSYGLVQCIPADVTMVSQEPRDRAMLIRASAQVNDKKRIMRLIFVQDKNDWKLDIPESLHSAMGDNWESQVAMTEQLYLMLRPQMGDQINCSMIQNLMKPHKQQP